MSPVEVMEQAALPEKYKPMGAWGYFWLSILFKVPVVGLVFLIVFTFSDGNISRRSYARSYWCGAILSCVVFLIVLLIAVLTGSVSALFSFIGDKLSDIMSF